ncbi:MAG: DEAD/DEAH box helicase [Burkholderiaceae bacterium]
MRALSEAGYEIPTPIQSKAIPLIMAGADLMAAAQTGTGKTAGFVLPILHRLTASSQTRAKPGKPRCLILTPTRELAAQVGESVTIYGKHSRLRSTIIFGGVNVNPQYAALRQPIDILVATPGRLLDHAGQKTVDFSEVEILVLDEADRMLDMGFIHDIKRVIRMLPPKRQSLLFSATFSDEIRTLARGLLKDPKEVDVAPRNTASELVDQSMIRVEKKQKRAVLSWLIGSQRWEQVLVFTRTKHGANRLAQQLEMDGIRAMAIHGNKSQGARTRALSEFKQGSLRVLVATDIAARGLDIDQLPHVVNYELPNVSEDYVHRIGRTGRAGASGWAVSLVDAEEVSLLRQIERLVKRTIAPMKLAGLDEAIKQARVNAPPDDPAPQRPAGANHRPGSRSGRPGGKSSSSRAPGPGKRPTAASANGHPARPRNDGTGPARTPGSSHPRPQAAEAVAAPARRRPFTR